MQVHIMELGREKADKVVEVKEIADLYGEVCKYLVSRDIELRYDKKKNEGVVIVGGFRKVGKFSVITDKIPKESLHLAPIVFKKTEVKL